MVWKELSWEPRLAILKQAGDSSTRETGYLGPGSSIVSLRWVDLGEPQPDSSPVAYLLI